jgi:hypothetical protein
MWKLDEWMDGIKSPASRKRGAVEKQLEATWNEGSGMQGGAGSVAEVRGGRVVVCLIPGSVHVPASS